jgi:hypothetical protein
MDLRAIVRADVHQLPEAQSPVRRAVYANRAIELMPNQP